MQHIKGVYKVSMPGSDNVSALVDPDLLTDYKATVLRYNDIISDPYDVRRLRYEQCDEFILEEGLWKVLDKQLESYPPIERNGYNIEAGVYDIDTHRMQTNRRISCQYLVNEWRIVFDEETEARVYLRHELRHNNNDLELKIYSTNSHIYNERVLQVTDTMMKLLDTRDSGGQVCIIS